MDEAMPVSGSWQLGAPPSDSVAAVQAVQAVAPLIAIRPQSAEVAAARNLTAQAAAALPYTAAFQQLDPDRQSSLLRDVATLEQALETPDDLRRRIQAGRAGSTQPAPAPTAPAAPATPSAVGPTGPSTAATSTIAARAGALSDEIDFPKFVAGLVHGTFDAIVDANVRQMETFASLVSAVAKDVDSFTRENITHNQVRDWLVERYPNDLELDPASHRRGQPKLRKRPKRSEEQEEAPAWLEEYGLGGNELTNDVIEDQLVPAARNVVGEQRMQMLATMVLMGMSRVVVRDGSISARLRFRAVARDKASVDYATSSDSGGGGGWGSRGSASTENHATMVSTVGANVQTDSMLDAQLFGEVKINFVSETLPLERFVDAASMAFMERNSRPAAAARTAAPQPGAPAPAASGLVAPNAAPAPAAPAVAAPTTAQQPGPTPTGGV